MCKLKKAIQCVAKLVASVSEECQHSLSTANLRMSGPLDDSDVVCSFLDVITGHLLMRTPKQLSKCRWKKWTRLATEPPPACLTSRIITLYYKAKASVYLVYLYLRAFISCQEAVKVKFDIQSGCVASPLTLLGRWFAFWVVTCHHDLNKCCTFKCSSAVMGGLPNLTLPNKSSCMIKR
jgi:hypothetical protein